MVEFLNYLQEKDKMIREFKFFHGVTILTSEIQGIVRTLRAQWRPELIDDLNTVHTIDAEMELTRLLSDQIIEELDNEMVNRLTIRENDEMLNEIIRRRINGGHRA